MSDLEIDAIMKIIHMVIGKYSHLLIFIKMVLIKKIIVLLEMNSNMKLMSLSK